MGEPSDRDRYGERDPSLSLAMRLARLLETPVEEIIFLLGE